MNKQSIKFFVIFCCCMIFSVVAVKAQSKPVFEIQIPFEFVVNDRVLPSGTYSIGRLNADNPDLLILKNTEGKTKIIFQTQRLNGGSPNGESRLTFYRFGNIYLLDCIWASGEIYGNRLPAGKLGRKRLREDFKPQVTSLRGN